MPQPTTPGPYLYRNPLGGDPQPVRVVDVDGVLIARFAGADDVNGEDMLVEDLAGDFDPT